MKSCWDLAILFLSGLISPLLKIIIICNLSLVMIMNV